MMPAEKWYEYQDSYKRYGIDLKPKAEPVVKPKKKSGVTAKDRLAIMALTFVTGLVCISLIIATAYGASIKYDINNMIKENAVITGEIENLTVKLNQANNIQTIEQRAAAELGMVYPNPDEFIYVQHSEAPVKDFALVLKEEAYN